MEQDTLGCDEHVADIVCSSIPSVVMTGLSLRKRMTREALGLVSNKVSTILFAVLACLMLATGPGFATQSPCQRRASVRPG